MALQVRFAVASRLLPFRKTTVTDELNRELRKLLDQYDDKRRAEQERLRQVQAKEDAFESEFAHLRSSAVRPVFEAAGAILKERGHDFSISENEFAVDQDGKITEAGILIRIFPARVEGSTRPIDQFPSLSYVARHYNKTVGIYGTNMVPKTGGAAGPRGDYQLTQISTELVEAELLQLIAGIVNK